MKQLTKVATLKVLISIIILSFIQAAVLAQDTTHSSTTVTTHQETSTWYTSPWVWIVGIAVFILLLVALLGGKKRDKTGTTDKVTVTKSIRTDRDTGTV